MSNFLLDFLALNAILSAILVITENNQVISVLFIISVFVSVAGYLVVLGVDFVGISYIIVYIGAVTVLFLFVVMILNLQLSELKGKEYTKNIIISAVTLFVFEILNKNFESKNTFSELGLGFFNYFNYFNSVKFKEINNNILQTFNTAETEFTNYLQIQSIGQVLYTNGVIWLIITSIILLLAIVAPITLSMNKNKEY